MTLNGERPFDPAIMLMQINHDFFLQKWRPVAVKYESARLLSQARSGVWQIKPWMILPGPDFLCVSKSRQEKIDVEKTS